MGIYAFAGLIGGTFNKVNRYLCILGYILSCIIVFAYTSGIQSNVNSIRDILIGALIVSILPKSFFNKIESAVKININTSQSVNNYIVRTKNLTNSKLENMQRAYNELANTFEKIRQKDEIINLLQLDDYSFEPLLSNEQLYLIGDIEEYQINLLINIIKHYKIIRNETQLYISYREI